MMRVDWQPALVLQKRAYRETSLQLELLTRDHGIIGLIAKGATGAKNHILRAQLQPLQHIKVSYQLKSELGLLTHSEALPPSHRFEGDRLMAGLYLNELVLRMCPRHDADSALYAMLLEARGMLSGTSGLAWQVRRFERDLIGHLGYTAPWSYCASGEQIRADASYRMHLELGLLPCNDSDPAGIPGLDLIAFNSDQLPERQALMQLRSWLHSVIAQHTGKSQPRSWQIIGELSRPLPKA